MSLEGRIVENELMRAAMDAARIGLCVADADGHIVVLAGDFAAKLGTDAQALIGRDSRHLLVPGLLLHKASEVLAIDAADTAAEARYTDADGRTSVLLFQARTLDHGDAGRYRVITLIDVTDFGVTRDRYLELRRQLDALNSAVVVTDARRADLPIVYVNRRFEELTGYAADEVVGRNCRFLQGELRDQPEVDKLREAIERRASCHVVLANVRKDGRVFENELFISPVFDEAGTVTHFIGLQSERAVRSMPTSNASASPA